MEFHRISNQTKFLDIIPLQYQEAQHSLKRSLLKD